MELAEWLVEACRLWSIWQSITALLLHWTTESQKILSWEAPKRIIESNSWRHADCPKFKPYVREHCPNSPWSPAAWGHDCCHGQHFHAHCPLVKNFFLMPTQPFPDAAPCCSFGFCQCPLWGTAGRSLVCSGLNKPRGLSCSSHILPFKHLCSPLLDAF